MSGERAALRLPAPASAAVRCRPASSWALPGLEPFLTSNRDFYRVDTALDVPQISPEPLDAWRSEGLVDRPLELTYDDLLTRPLVERDLTLVCVSNEVGGHLAGTARWPGVPLADLLREAGVRAGREPAGQPIRGRLHRRDARSTSCSTGATRSWRSP